MSLPHLQYPHILDLVISFACWDTKLAFRATSRAIRERVDKQLFAHVVVRQTLGRGMAFSAPEHLLPLPLVRDKSGDAPAVPHVWLPEWEPASALCRRLVARFVPLLPPPSDGTQILGAVPTRPTRGSGSPPPALVAALAHARVLDFGPNVHIGSMTYPRLDAALTGVHTARRVMDSNTDPFADTVVDYLYIVHEMLQPGETPGELELLCVPDVHDGTTRQVINVLYDPTAPRLHDANLLFDCCCPTTHVVFAFTQYNPESDRKRHAAKEEDTTKESDAKDNQYDFPDHAPVPRPPPPRAPPAADLMSSFLGLFLDFVAQRTHLSYTLIGIEDIPRALIGLAPTMSDDDVFDAVRKVVENAPMWSDGEDSDSNGEESGHTLRILSRDAYAAEIGGDAFSIQVFDPEVPLGVGLYCPPVRGMVGVLKGED